MARNFQRGQRQTKEWTRIPGVQNAFTAAATAVGTPLDFTESRTILRMLGEYTAGATGGGTVAETDFATIAVGIGIVSTDASAVGASAMPDPNAEADYPWLYWASHVFQFPSGGDNGATEGASIRRMFDIRSMRKVKPRESLVFVVEYEDIAGAPPITFSAGSTRVLLGH